MKTITLEQARKDKSKSLLAICTLGLSAVPWSTIFSSAKDSDKGMSFEKNAGISFVFDCIMFVFYVVICSVPLWIFNIFKFIDRSIYVHKLENAGH